MFDLAVHTLVILAFAAFVAGFIDSIAGGGGLVTVPALLLAGFAPVDSIATNKLQALFGTGSATLTYAARGQVAPRKQLPLAVTAFGGGVIGALAATVAPVDVLNAALPVLLIAIALYFALKPNMDDLDRARRLSPFLFAVTLVPLIGFYDGIFGPGAGSFYMLAFIALGGYGVTKATAHTKLLNFSSNLGGFALFAAVGVVHWKIGLLMGVCQFLGARIGALLAIRGGARLIKPLLVIVCMALAIKLLTDPANPLRTLVGI